LPVAAAVTKIARRSTVFGASATAARAMAMLRALPIVRLYTSTIYDRRRRVKRGYAGRRGPRARRRGDGDADPGRLLPAGRRRDVRRRAARGVGAALPARRAAPNRDGVQRDAGGGRGAAGANRPGPRRPVRRALRRAVRGRAAAHGAGGAGSNRSGA